MNAFLFDLDGTLVDLEVDIAAVRRELAELFEPRGYRGEFRPILAAIDEAARAVADEPAEIAELVRRGRDLIDRAEVAAAAAAEARPGAHQLIARLTSSGCRLGLVTDNSRACIGPALSRAGLAGGSWVAPAMVSRDEVARPKPAPDGVVAAARALLPAGGELLLVGDSPRDVAAGRAAQPLLSGIELRIIVVDGGRGRLESSSNRPDAVIASLEDL